MRPTTYLLGSLALIFAVAVTILTRNAFGGATILLLLLLGIFLRKGRL